MSGFYSYAGLKASRSSAQGIIVSGFFRTTNNTSIFIMVAVVDLAC